MTQKIKVYGGLSRNNRRGAAPTGCRDHIGQFLASSAIVFSYIIDPPILEVLACREALGIALHLSLDQVVIACNCKTIVAETKAALEGRYNDVIKEVAARAREFRRCDFIFEGRQMNVDTHNLAIFSTSLNVRHHLWLGMPYDLSVIHVNLTSTS